MLRSRRANSRSPGARARVSGDRRPARQPRPPSAPLSAFAAPARVARDARVAPAPLCSPCLLNAFPTARDTACMNQDDRVASTATRWHTDPSILARLLASRPKVGEWRAHRAASSTAKAALVDACGELSVDIHPAPARDPRLA